MRFSVWTRLCVCGFLIAGVLITGCRDREPVEVDTTEDLIERPAPPEPPPEERARQIMAEVTRVEAEDVTITEQAAAGDILTIEATIPAHEKMLPHHAAAPDTGGGAETQQRVEWVRLVWNTATERPQLIRWPERLQFAEEQPVGDQAALATARLLKGKWFPDVPVEMRMREPRRLHMPTWIVSWRGHTENDTLSGDQVAVQVSALTGLPIEYTQRVAKQRPSRDEIEITREEAIDAAREMLIGAEFEGAEQMALVARLVLSAPQHPEGGPAWLVRGTGEQDMVLVPVDAMSGELLTSADDSEKQRGSANDSNA